MKFLIQTVNDEIVHDFTFTLLEALRYHKWCGRDYHMAMVTDSGVDEPGWIPVGSVEFVQGYLKDAYDLTVKPHNVPEELMVIVFSGRAMRNTIADKTIDLSNENLFVKSNDKIKCELDLAQIPPGRYQLSSLVDFTSEWRAFIWRGELVGLQNYAGDFTQFPDVTKIRLMMGVFAPNAPCAYTLDVGVCDGVTLVVEVHDFFSCGLYGFADLQLLPLLFGGWFNEFLRETNETVFR